jgi:hypothetical protein
LIFRKTKLRVLASRELQQKLDELLNRQNGSARYDEMRIPANFLWLIVNKN